MGYLDDLIAERENMISRGEIPAPLPYKPHKDFELAAAYAQSQRRIAEQEAWDSFVGKPQPVRVDENGVPIEQPQTDDNSWGVTRGLLSGGAGVLQGQAQLANLAGIGDGAAADCFGKIMQKNARKKEYTIGDMLPFASDYWTNGEGAAYDVGNMLGSSVVLGAETAAAMATGGAALGALGIGNGAAAAVASRVLQAGGSAAAAKAAAKAAASGAKAAFMSDAITSGMARAANKFGMKKLANVLEGPMGKLYAANILKTPLEASSEAGNAGAEALANGASLSDAQRQALIVGGLQMPLLALSNTMESAGLGGLFLKEAEEATGKKLGKEGFLSILGNITREGMQNAWEEGMQQSTHEYAAGKQNLLGVVNPLQWSYEAAQQAAVGAVGGAVIGGGNAGMRAYVTREQTAPTAENTPAVTTPTPAQQAREYLDTIGQQEDKFTPEQIATLREVAENGDDETVVNTATQFGWQAPGAQQQEQGQQAQPAPVTPASTPEEQIQTATNAVNAATANVVNGGEVVGDNGGEQGTSAPVQQPTPAQQPMQEPAQTATPAVQQPSTSPRADTSATAPTNTLANTLVHDVVERLKNTEYKALVNGDGTIDTDRLRRQFNIKKFLNEHPEASAVAQAALNGDKAALTQLKKYKPEHQAAALDKAINGDDNWKYTEQELQKLENDAQTTLNRNVTQIRQKMNNKIKGRKKDKTLSAEQQNELASAASSTDLGKIISTALTYGIKVPAATIAYYQENIGDGTAPVIVKNALAPKQPQGNANGSKKNKGGKKVDNHGDNNTGGNNANTNTGGKEGEGGKADGDDGNKSGNAGGDKNVTSDVNGVDTGDKGDNGGKEEVDIPKKLGDKVSDGEYKGMPRFKSEDGKVKYTLNTETNEVTRRVGNKRSEKIPFDSLEEAMNFIADDEIEEKNSWISNKIGNFVTDKEGDNDSTSHDYYRIDGPNERGIDSARVTKHIMKEDKNHKPLEVEYSVLFYDADGETIDDYDVKTLEEVEAILNSEGDSTKGGNNNATDENGTGENGSDKGSENPVQGKQPKEPVKAETDDNQGEGDNGEVEVDKNDKGGNGEPSEEPTKKPVKKTTQPKAPVQKEEAVALDKVLEKYKGNADDRGIIKVLSGISKKDAPVAKQHNSIAIKKLADDIMQKYNDGELSLEEAHAQLRNLNGAYSNHSGVFAEVDGVNGKKYLAELVKKLKSEIDNAATTAKKNRADALSNAVKNSQNLIQEFKENKRNFDDTLKSIEKLKNDIIAEFDKLGVKKLGVAERKSIYDEPIKEIGKLQKEKEREQQQSTTPQELEGPQTSTDNENKNKAKETSESNQKKLTPAEAVAEKLDGLKKLEEEIQDIFDEETGELNVPKSMGLQSRADKLSVSEDDFSNAQTELILAAKAKFKAAFNLALAQGKADAAGIAVDSKEKPSATEVSDAVSGFIDTSTLENDADARSKAQNIILKSFTDEQQKVLGNFDLASITEELLNVYDDKDETNAFINEKTADVDSEAADLIGQYISRMKNAYVKADNIYGLQDDYDQKAAKLAGLQKGKYSVRIGGKLGEAMYQAAWHGSPYIIEGNLQLGRVGTGEGTAAHGYGLYFAKNRYTSSRYRKILSSKNPLTGTIKLRNSQTGELETFDWNDEEVKLKLDETIGADDVWGRIKAKVRNWGERAFQRLKEETKSIINFDKELLKSGRYKNNIEQITLCVKNIASNQRLLDALENGDLVFNVKQVKGDLLSVEIPENDVLLDEHKAFENQPFRVREALKRIFEKLPNTNFDLKGKTGKLIYEALGIALNGGKEKSLVYSHWSHRMELNLAAAEKASMALRQQGLKGIHYIGGLDGECFVIWDENAIAIKHKYDAALRKHQEEIQRSRSEVVDKIKSMFSGSKFEEQENGDLLITTKGGNKILYKITDRIVLNGAEAQEARKAHGITDDAEVTAEGRYRTVYEGDIDAMVEVGLDSRKNTEAHETTHAVINLALGEEGSKPLFERAEKLIKEYGLKADKEEVACDAVRDFITARENGFITTFTASERAELSKTFWGRMMLRANEMGAKAKVLSDNNEAEFSKTAWGKMLLAKLKLQRNFAKLLSKIYDFYKKFRAARDANENFHNLARKIELGEVWNEKSDKAASSSATQYSARPSKGKDFTISSINIKYKKELEQAFERNANAGDITAIQNRHQEELAQYLKDKGEKQKEKAKLRAAELRELRKKLKAGEIDSFEMAGGRVTLDKDGKEKFESIQDPNELPSFIYKNNQHNDEAYKNATAIQKLNASIKRPEEKGVIQSTKDWLKDAKDKFYKQWVDKYDALGILDKAIAKKGGKPADNSMTILSQMQMVTNYATGAARALVEGDENSLKPLVQKWGIKGNTSLGMMMEKLETDHKSGKYKDYIKKSSINGGTGAQDYVNALENYLTALTLWESAQNHKLDYDREVAEWQKKGARGEKPKETPYKFPNNLTEDDIKQIIRSAPAEFKGYQKMFKSVTDDLLNIMLKSGLITLDRYDTLKDRYKFYCPLYRDFSDTAAVDDLVTQINAGRGLGNVSDPLKSRSSEGSFRDVSAPLTNAVKSISAICAKAERNRVGQYAVKEAKKHKLDEFIREVKGNARDAKNCIFTVMFNGEKHAYQTVPELYPAITAAVEPLCKIQMAVLTKPAQLLRAGSTMSPSFIIRNFLRDTIFAAVSSKNGFIPIYDSIRGGYAYLKNKQLRGEYEAAGVFSSNYYSDNEAVTKSLNEMAGGKTWQEMTPLDIAKAFVKKPVARLEWLSELIENSTRMGEFMKARAKGKSIEQAGHDAVEVSLNFNRSGATGQQINRMVPFFNACIQGGDKMYRLFKANPRDTALKIATFIVLPSLALWVYNHDEDWYKDIDPNIKMTNWIVGGLRIPKPQEAGILFGSGLEAMLDTANGQDPKAMKEWRHNVIEALTPGFLPTVILPIIEWMANYSFFRDKPVVSQALQRLPDEMQYGPYTSETAKGIGSITGLSPVKIDNLWRGYTGTMGMFLFQAPDLFAAEKQNLPEKKVSEMTVVRDFIVNDMNMNRTMNEFYELKNAATQKHAGYGKKGKPSAEVAGVNIAAQSIQKLQKEAREITASSKYNSAQKRVLIDKLQAKQKKIAQACIKKYGSKFDY